MCFGGGGDGGASASAAQSREDARIQSERQEAQAAQDRAEAQAREDARQARLTQGRAGIDQAFAGFNDEYYKGVEKRNNDYYNPLIQRQYDEAYRTLMSNLARSGNMTSSSGIRRVGQLEDTFNQQKAAQAERAAADANSIRGNVENNRAQLNSQLDGSVDGSNVDTVTTAAANRANLTANPNPLQPLGDIFGSLLAQGANYVAASNQNPGTARTFGTTLFGPSKSSATIVN